MGKRASLSIFWITFVLALLARAALVGRQSLWADEIFSLAMATGHSLEHPASEARPELGDYLELPGPAAAAHDRALLEHGQPPGGLSRVTRALLLSDTSPPLYYYALHFWTRWLGTSDASVHGFSALCAVLCLPLLCSVARRVGGRVAILPVVLLFALSPLCICYSIEGRMYSTVWLLALVLAHLTFQVHRRGDPLSFLLWLVAVALNLLTHYYSAFLVGACGLWLLFFPRRLRRLWLLPGCLLALFLILPWYRLVPESLGRWRVTYDWLHGLPSIEQALAAPFHLLWSFFSNGGKWGGSGLADKMLFALILIAAIGLLMRRGRRCLSAPRWLPIFWLAGACIGPLLFDALRGTCSSLIPRYALSGMPAAFLLLGYGLSRLPRVPGLLIAAAIVLCWVPGLCALYRIPSRDSEPYREACELLERESTGEDLILVHSIPSGVLGVARYLDADLPMASWVEQLKVRRVPEDIERLIAGRRKVAFVEVHTVGSQIPEKDWLLEHAEIEAEHRLQGILVTLFRPRTAERF